MQDKLKNLKQIITNHDVVSFDIFDTLLLRPYTKPADLFLHLEKLCGQTGFSIARTNAEKKARKIHSRKEEVTFDQIYDQIDNQYKYLKHKELDLENQILRVNDEIKDIYEYAVKLNKTVIFISDMYLPKEFVEKVLNKNGYTIYHKLYISSDLNLTKRSASLYKYALNDLGIKPQAVLHIGDNYHADCEMSKKSGISCFYYPKKIDRLLASNRALAAFHKNNSHEIGCSVILGVLSLSSREKSWQSIGYEYAGPAIFSYVKWLDSAFKSDEIDHAFFVARDGYSLQKVFDLIKTSETKSHYIYAPRNLNLIVNLDIEAYEKNKEEFLWALRSIFWYYKDKDPYLKANTPDQTSLSEAIDWFKSNIELYKQLSDLEKTKYKHYLESHLSNCKALSIVDTITGKFTSQRLIEDTLRIDYAKTIGYYWCFDENVNSEHLSNRKFKKFQEEKFNLFFLWRLMELFITAPEPPIVGVENGSPVYNHEVGDDEEFRMRVYPDICKGIMMFSETAHEIFGNSELFLNARLTADLINNLVLFSSDAEKSLLSETTYATTAMHVNYKPLINWNKFKDSSFKLYLYKILSIIYFGKKRAHYTRKYMMQKMLKACI